MNGQDIRDKQVWGPEANILVVRADDSDARDWMASSAIAPSLSNFGIAHCGIMDVGYPFEVVRVRQAGAFFFACFEGEGQVLIEGNWRTVGRGDACVQPPFIPNVLKARKEKRWKFCWVRFQPASKSTARVSLHTPAVAAFDSHAIRHAIQGLSVEAGTATSPTALTKWADLINWYFTSFSKPLSHSPLLAHLWGQVERSLCEPWSLNELACIAEISKEHLRRLCLQTFGRSPMQHVAFLRMCRAAELLQTSDASIAEIATQVGYANQFSFSDTFKRIHGCRPSTLRQEKV